jgi:hypothetical protein
MRAAREATAVATCGTGSRIDNWIPIMAEAVQSDGIIRLKQFL